MCLSTGLRKKLEATHCINNLQITYCQSKDAVIFPIGGLLLCAQLNPGGDFFGHPVIFVVILDIYSWLLGTTTW